MPTLYDKYGGTPTMKILVREFYKQARINPTVRHYFDKLDMEKLIDHQVQFLSVVLGKPARTYTGRELADAHHPLNISDAEFDEIGQILVGTLKTGGVSTDDITLIMGVVLEIRDEIVDRAKQSLPAVQTLRSPMASTSPVPTATTPTPTRPELSKAPQSTQAENSTDKVSSIPAPTQAVPTPEQTQSDVTTPGFKQQQKATFRPVFGGLPRIKIIVRDLYSQVNDQPDLRHYFLNVTPEKIIADQEHFASYVLRKADHAYLGGFLQSSDLSQNMRRPA